MSTVPKVHPPHPSVDWSTLSRISGEQTKVEVRCPWCKETRRECANHVTYRIKRGSFTGYCYKDRLVGSKRADRMDRPDHPTVNWDDTEVHLIRRGNRSQRLTLVRVTCPR